MATRAFGEKVQSSKIEEKLLQIENLCGQKVTKMNELLTLLKEEKEAKRKEEGKKNKKITKNLQMKKNDYLCSVSL